MFQKIRALFNARKVNARKSFRWSLNFVHKREGLRYALHGNAVAALLGYVIGPIDAGKRISPDWELHVTYNLAHKAIRLVEQYFSDGNISKELLSQILAIDSGWLVPGGEPVFVDTHTRKQLPLGMSGRAFMSDAQKRRAIEKRSDNLDDEEVTLESVLSKVIFR